MKRLLNLLFPREAVVLDYKNFFGQGFDLGLDITNQKIEDTIRVIEGIPYMQFGGSLGKVTFYVPANIKTFRIDSFGVGSNSEKFLLKKVSRRHRRKTWAWKANQRYPKNRIKVYY